MNEITYQFPMIIWDAKRVRGLFDSSPFVFDIKYDFLSDEFSEVHFNFGEKTSATMKFLCGYPDYLMISSDEDSPEAMWRINHFLCNLAETYYPHIIRKEQ